MRGMFLFNLLANISLCKQTSVIYLDFRFRFFLSVLHALKWNY